MTSKYLWELNNRSENENNNESMNEVSTNRHIDTDGDRSMNDNVVSNTNRSNNRIDYNELNTTTTQVLSCA